MSLAPIHLAGELLQLDPEGGLFWPAQRMLVVADLHFEKGSAAALKGSLLPPWDTSTTLDRLTRLLRRYRPAWVVALGDSFHDAKGSGRLLSGDHARLSAITQSIRFTWVLGNHDPSAPAGIGGEWAEEVSAGPLVFRHQGRPGGAAGELCGHHHPKASIPVRAATVTRPCFVADGWRLMLPALGAYTGGLDVRDPAIAELYPRGGRVFLLGRDRLFSFGLAPNRVRPRVDRTL